MDEVRVNTLKDNRNGTSKVATVRLPEKSAERLIAMKKVKVGWIYCQVDEIVRPIRCYNCQGHGHTAKDCDREKMEAKKICRRCGGTDGHEARGCTKDTYCYECKQRDHQALSMSCPLHRQAVRQKKRERRKTNKPQIQ